MNIEEIPSEVLGDIFSYLSLKESYLVARVCKKFHFALGETKELSINANSNFIVPGLDYILRSFPRLITLRLCSKEKNPKTNDENLKLVKLAKSFKLGHPTLQHIKCSSSAIIYGTKFCPNLKSLTIDESFIMPIPHIIETNYENGIASLFRNPGKNIKSISLSTPLLYTINRFSDWYTERDDDYDIDNKTLNENNKFVSALTSLESLSMSALSADALADFLNGFVKRTNISSLTSLTLSGDSVANMTDSGIRYIYSAFPNLIELNFKAIKLGPEHFQELFENYKLKKLSFNCCDINLGIDFHHPQPLTLPDYELEPGHTVKFSKNVAQAVVDLLCAHFPELTELEVYRCSFVNADDDVTEVISANHATGNCSKSKLEKLTLMGFGKYFPVVKFITDDHPNLKYLRLDDVPHYIQDGAFVNDFVDHVCQSLRFLEDLELRFTRTKSILDTVLSERRKANPFKPGYATSLRLKSLVLHAPKTQLFNLIVASQNTLHYLKLSYVEDDLLEDKATFTLSSLKTLSLHCHEEKALSTSLKLANAIVIDGNCKKLVDLKIQVKKPLSLLLANNDSQLDTDDEDIVHSTTHLLEKMLHTCTSIRSLEFDGINTSPEAIEKLISAPLSSLSLNINAVPSLEEEYDTVIRKLVLSNRRLKNFELAIQKLPKSMVIVEEGLSNAEEQVDVDRHAEIFQQIKKRDLLMENLCNAYKEDIYSLAHWLGNVSITAPCIEIKNHRFRSGILRRIARNNALSNDTA